MNDGLISRIGETIDHQTSEHPGATPGQTRTLRLLRWFLPNGGTLLLMGLLIFTQNVWAGQSLRNLTAQSAASTGTIAYQGRLADSGGNPLTETVGMEFRLYNVATGGTPLWTEQWTGASSVQVSDGLFNVMLGSLAAIPQNVITGNSTLFLGITVDADNEMTPRIQLGSVPFAVQALTVPDLSVTEGKLGTDAVTSAKIKNGEVKADDIAPDAVTSAKIADNSVLSANVAFNYAGSTSEGGAASNLACTDCVASTEVAFNYAGSTSEGGAASNLACTDCVASTEVGFNYAASSTKGGIATNADKLDNKDSTAFLERAGGTMTGILTLNNQLNLKANVTSAVNTNITIDAGNGSLSTLTLGDMVVIPDVLPAGGKNLLVGDDAYFSDIDTANTLGLYGNSSGTFGTLKANIVSPSSRAYKTDIASLDSADYSQVLDEISRIDMVYYHLLDEDKGDDPLRLGLIAEEVPAELRGPDDAGIDLYKLASFTLAGLKALAAKDQKSAPLTIEGIGTLQDGSARIALDPAFAHSGGETYLIHLTPYGDASLYVAEIGDSFVVVRSREAGQNIAFAWQARKVTSSSDIE
jgi:hypothetical protein